VGDRLRIWLLRAAYRRFGVSAALALGGVIFLSAMATSAASGITVYQEGG